MTASTRKGLTPIEALRIDGPLDTTTLAGLIDEPWVTVLNHCQDLEDHGFVRSLPDLSWDVTAEGRLYADAQLAVRRDGARACVGVSQA